MELTTEAILALIKDIGAPAVGVLLAFKFAIHGLIKDIADIKTMVYSIDNKVDRHEVRLVRVETLVDPDKPVRLVE